MTYVTYVVSHVLAILPLKILHKCDTTYAYSVNAEAASCLSRAFYLESCDVGDVTRRRCSLKLMFIRVVHRTRRVPSILVFGSFSLSRKVIYELKLACFLYIEKTVNAVALLFNHEQVIKIQPKSCC